MILHRLLCKLFGHKWRRLTKKEHDAHGFQIFAGAHGGTTQTMRICRRCGAERIVKARKKTKETTE